LKTIQGCVGGRIKIKKNEEIKKTKGSPVRWAGVVTENE